MADTPDYSKPAAYSDRDEIVVVDELGQRAQIKRSELPNWEAGGYRQEGIEEGNRAYLKQEYGDQEGQAFLQGAAKVATFGTSDILLNELDPEGAKYIPEFSPNAYLGGELTMGVLGSGVGLGGAVTRGAKAIEGAVGAGGATLGRRVGGYVAGGAAEGGAYGVGEGVSKVAKSEGPTTAEGALATIGSNALGGALIGGVVNTGGKLLGEGGKAVKEYAETRAAKAKQLVENTAEEGIDRVEYNKIAHLDEGGTKQAIAGAKESIKARKAVDIAENETLQQAERQLMKENKQRAVEDLYDEATTWKDKRVKDFIQPDDSSIAAHMGKAREKIQRGLDDRTEFLTKGGAGKFQKGLAEEETALNRVLQGSDEILETAGERQQRLYDGLPKPSGEPIPLSVGPEARGPGGRLPKEPKIALTMEESNAWREWKQVKRPKVNKAVHLNDSELADFVTAVERGEAMPVEVATARKAMAQLEENQAMQARFKEVQAEAQSPYLEHLQTRAKQIDADTTPTPELRTLEHHLAELQKDTFGKKIARGLGSSVGASVGGAVGGSPGAFVGAQIGQDIGNAMHRLVRGIRTGNQARQSFISKTIQGIGQGGKAAAKATSKNLPKASLVLDGIRYSEPGYVNAVMGPANYKASKDPTVNNFHERKRELDSITERTPGGGFQMRAYAMDDLGERLAPVWQMAPQIANEIEKGQQQKVAYLASVCPRDPTPPHLQVGPNTWEPNKAEVAKFARIMEVAEDPSKAVARIADGTATPADVETLKNVWPAHYDQIRQQCMDHMAQMQATMPYQQRLSMSILFDVAVDPALTPEVLGVFQRKVENQGGGPSGGPAPPQQNKPLPQGMIQPTRSQRMSAK